MEKENDFCLHNIMMSLINIVLLTLNVIPLIIEAFDAACSSGSSASLTSGIICFAYGPRNEITVAANAAEEQIENTFANILTARRSAINACKAALLSLTTSLKSGPDYDRLRSRLSSFLLKIHTEGKNTDGEYTIISSGDETSRCYLAVDSNMKQLERMATQKILEEHLTIKNLLLMMKENMKKSCESMVMLFIQHAKVYTKKFITLQPETETYGDGFVCFIICFEKKMLESDLYDLLTKFGTIHNLVKKADLSDGTNLFDGTNVFEVRMILSSHVNVTIFFQSLVSEIPSAVPVLYSTE